MTNVHDSLQLQNILCPGELKESEAMKLQEESTLVVISNSDTLNKLTFNTPVLYFRS